MQKRTRVLIAGLATGVLAVGMTATAYASPGHAPKSPKFAPHSDRVSQPDEILTPDMARERAEKQEAINLVASGKAQVVNRGESHGVQLPNGRWVQYGAPKVAKIFTILAEFGATPKAPNNATPGPLHNQIAKPDRNWDGSATDDNITEWRADYSQAYYQDLLNNPNADSMSDFYLRQSSGRYTVTGEVTPWVKLPGNEARYGNNADQTEGYDAFVGDTVKAWTAQQKAAGRTDAQIADYLKQFDQWDRNDYNDNGIFDEPDGYLDHVQILHAGEGEEAGGGAQGDDAIWSHSSQAQMHADAPGPYGDERGGFQFGTTGIWVGRYTTEPENGGLGVFCHEYGHDIGLPDYYDTADGDNGTGSWTLMSSGSWMGRGGDNIGDKPSYMGPNEKLFLGWLDYNTVELKDKTTYSLLGAAGAAAPFKQATMVKLPNRPSTKEYTKPFAGQGEWFGGEADNIDAKLTRTLDLTGATSASITAKVNYQTEQGYDYLYGKVSLDGKSWQTVGTAYDGNSNGWVDVTYDLSAYVGKTVQFRYNYQTDGGVHFAGVMIDNVSLTKNGAVVFTDGVETGENGWTAKGWTLTNGSITQLNPHFYLVENRQFTGYDTTLQTGPYVFTDRANKPNWVEHFAYQTGILIWYVDGMYGDNNTSAEGQAGHGQALPVDAHGAAIWYPSGKKPSNDRQVFDAPFSLHKPAPVTFRQSGEQVKVANPAVSVFDDSNVNAYWDAANPLSSVKVAGTGVKIRVLLDGQGQVLPALISITR